MATSSSMYMLLLGCCLDASDGCWDDEGNVGAQEQYNECAKERNEQKVAEGTGCAK
jgi:hypothetical protein